MRASCLSTLKKSDVLSGRNQNRRRDIATVLQRHNGKIKTGKMKKFSSITSNSNTSSSTDIGMISIGCLSLLFAQGILNESSSSPANTSLQRRDQERTFQPTKLAPLPQSTTITTTTPGTKIITARQRFGLVEDHTRIAEEVISEYLAIPLDRESSLPTALWEKFQSIYQEREGKYGNYKATITSILLGLQGEKEKEADEKKEIVSSEPIARFPSLQAHMINENGECEQFTFNANEPIDIDNDLFVGQVMLVLRPLSPENDPNFEERILVEQQQQQHHHLQQQNESSASATTIGDDLSTNLPANGTTPRTTTTVNGRPVTFQFQLQGKFKKPIRKDQLYLGAQLVDELKLGSWAKKISNWILMLLAKEMGSNMTYSFGSDKSASASVASSDGNDSAATTSEQQELEELPHISFPLYTGLENVVVSPSLQVAPKIGSAAFVEPKELKLHRKLHHQTNKAKSKEICQSNDTGDFNDHQENVWDTSDIYSLSYSASSIDLATWKILLPFEMNLSRFWGDSAVRLVIYHEYPEDEDDHGHDNNATAVKDKNTSESTKKKKDYLFNLQIKHVPSGIN